MLLPTTKSFIVLLVISLGMGLFDGCFISLLGPIVFDTCGRSGATQAIGFLLGMCSIPLTVGPPIAGLLYDHTGNVFNNYFIVYREGESKKKEKFLFFLKFCYMFIFKNKKLIIL